MEQYWTIRDVLIIRTVRHLRSVGASLDQVRRAADRLRDWDADFGNTKLFWDGTDVVVQTADGSALSAIRQPNQLVWLLTILPLGTWR